MDNLNIIISNNLKRIRAEKKLSLDRAAEMTGVSKSMLSQIERGESNPTVTTVWRIAKGLRVSFTALLNSPHPDTVILSKSDIEPLVEDNGRYRVYPYFPYEDGRRFEMYSVEIDKGGYFGADAHSEGTLEFITVFEGELTIRVDEDEYSLYPGNAIRIRADRPHAYHNSGSDLTRISMVIYYPE